MNMERRGRHISLGELINIIALAGAFIGFVWFASSQWTGLNLRVDKLAASVEELKGTVALHIAQIQEWKKADGK